MRTHMDEHVNMHPRRHTWRRIGTHEALLATGGLYARLYRTQFHSVEA